MPQSDTDPAYAGRVETMTLRFLEVMASGAVPIGRCPAEMRSLFGYDPVVPIDWAQPEAQLDAILSDIGAFQGLCERNLAMVRNIGTWDTRAAQIVAAMR